MLPSRAAALAALLASVLAIPACAGNDARPPQPRPTASSVLTPPEEGVVDAPPAPPATTTGVTPAPAGAPAQRNYDTHRLKVTGMTCPIRCVAEVKEQLMAVEGVLNVTIDQDRREAIVDVKPGTDPDTLVRGLKAPYAARRM